MIKKGRTKVGYMTKKYLHPIEFNFEHTQLFIILNLYIKIYY